MKRIYTSLSIVAATLALAGCVTPLALVDAQQPKASQPKGDLNTHACRDFEEEAGSIARDVLEFWAGDEEESSGEILDDAGREFQELAAESSGPVSQNLNKLATYVSANPLVMESTLPEEYFEHLDAVRAACAAEGVEIQLERWH